MITVMTLEPDDTEPSKDEADVVCGFQLIYLTSTRVS